MTMQQRPTLTPEEIASLRGHEASLATAQSVLTDLDAIGFDVAHHQQLLDTVEPMRAGLLERFSSTEYVAPVVPRRRAK